MLANLSANKMDTRIILNRGLTTADDESGGLGLRGKQDESLLETGPWKDSDIIFLRICLGAVEEAILSFYMIL